MKRFYQIIFAAAWFTLGVSNLCIASESYSEHALFAPQNVESAIRQAQARYDSGNIYGAWTLAEKIAEKYPSNQEVRALISTCVSREASDYTAAVESLSIDKLKDYLQVYQGKARSVDVNERIQDIPLWNTARSTNTIAAYNDYLAKSSNKKYADDAHAAINVLQLEQDWKTAKAGNTFEAYDKFRKAHPLSKYDSEASNNMAKRLADKFTRNSKDEDKIRALNYAVNEMTRDYVKNKYNASKSKTTGSYSSGSNSSSHYPTSSGSSSPDRPTSGNNSGYSSSGKAKQVSGYGGYSFGVSLMGESDFECCHNTGVGFMLRLGKHDKMFNIVFGLSYSFSVTNRSEYSLDYYDYQSYNVTYSGDQITIPMTLHWNLIRQNTWMLYLGAGYEFGEVFYPNDELDYLSNSALLKMGIGGGHWDWSIYNKITYPVDSPFGDSYIGFLGTSITYYF